MYSPATCAARQVTLEASPGVLEHFPHGIPRTPVAQCRTNQAILALIFSDVDKYGNVVLESQRRPLTPDEALFIRAERLLSTFDYRYWAERYCYIGKGGLALESLYPLWESQEMFLRALGKLEAQILAKERHDGIFVRGLKARQLGWSTMAQSLLAHRTASQGWTTALLASDTPDGSDSLFDMQERIIDALPWYMRPTIVERQKNDELVYESGARLLWAAGRSTRGQSKEAGGQGAKGQLGRGKTVSAFHLSELSTWDNPGQIRSAFYPAVPRHPRVLGLEESTAKGRHNYWHDAWLAAIHGTDDRRPEPVFVGWYAEPKKYAWPAPSTWGPSSQTLAHARKVELDAPRWMGHALSLTRAQLYWYEETRRAYEASDDLATFLEEFAADPDECFQHSGRSVFSLGVRQRVDEARKPALAYYAIEPRMDIQRLKDARG